MLADAKAQARAQVAHDNGTEEAAKPSKAQVRRQRAAAAKAANAEAEPFQVESDDDAADSDEEAAAPVKLQLPSE